MYRPPDLSLSTPWTHVWGESQILALLHLGHKLDQERMYRPLVLTPITPWTREWVESQVLHILHLGHLCGGERQIYTYTLDTCVE